MAAVAPAAVAVAAATGLRASGAAERRGGGGLGLAVRSAVPSGLGGAIHEAETPCWGPRGCGCCALLFQGQ